MDDTKPHKGKIEGWYKYEINPRPVKGQKHLGYLIMGTFQDHPDFGKLYTNTSAVVKHDTVTGEIETVNSRYTLIGKETVYHGQDRI